MDNSNTQRRKRKSCGGHNLTTPPMDSLTLSLSPYPHHPTATAPPPPEINPNAALSGRRRRNPTKTPPVGKPATIPPPFPWSGDLRANVRSLSYLRSQRISSISGDVQCKRCNGQYKMEFDLEQKFKEVASFVAENKANMRQRAPKIWMSPALPNCRLCNQENSVRPLISEKKKAINWLFLLLGQMLGCCTLNQLKYFCKHTRNHRTGAKDRVLFLAYLGLCRQLEPNGPFYL
ncbi:hypothetical protein ACS0TY_001761 [Phlomoides rotata]